MTHTTRIYNNPRIKKAQRYNVDNREDIHPLLRIYTDRMIGIPLTKRSWLCMGKCKVCRDPNREPRLLRKKRKEQFRLQLRSELNTQSITLEETNPWEIS